MAIWVFGHKPSPHVQEFKNKDVALDYLRRRLPEQDFRYRSTKKQKAESILFSFNGFLLAELVVDHCEEPTDDDLAGYENATNVYVIQEIRIFRRTDIKAKELGLSVGSFVKTVPQDVYAHIVEQQGGFEELIRR